MKTINGILLLCIFLGFSCSQKSELQESQKKIDSLSNELKKVKDKVDNQENSSTINNTQTQKGIRYGFIQIIFEKRFFTIRGSLGAYTISEEDGLKRNFNPENVEVEKKQFLSGIEQINFIDENTKYKLLDDNEQKFREIYNGFNPLSNGFSIKILSRNLRLFNSYAEASQAVSELKGIND